MHFGGKKIGKDGEIERLSREISELHKSKRQLMELLEQKDIEINEKNITVKNYLDKIVRQLLLNSISFLPLVCIYFSLCTSSREKQQKKNIRK